MSTSTRATERKKTARCVRLSRGRIPAALLKQMALDVREGAVILFPTETVYGLGTSAFSRQGVAQIYRLKGRRWNKPLQLLVSSLEAAVPLVSHIPPEAFRLAKTFCPGPLTLVLPASPLGRLVTGGLATIGIRVPDHPAVLALLKAIGLPLAATSANRSSEPPATSGGMAHKLFGRRVEWFIQGGTCTLREASSVVNFTHYPFTVQREGAIGKKKLEAVLFSAG